MTLLDKAEVVGGQATSIPIDEHKYGASWMNNGVQGGSHVCHPASLYRSCGALTIPHKIFKHTFRFFKKYGYPPQEVQLQVSFGQGPHGFWTNVFPSNLVERYASDIKRFGLFLRVVKWTLPILGLVPISMMLRLFFFTRDFGDKMVYPLIALFLGTGNQTPNVPCGIVERLFNDPNMKLWDYDSATLLPNLPIMYTFDNLDRFYKSWSEDLGRRGATIRTGTQVRRVLSRSGDGVKLQIQNSSSDDLYEETFDELVLCVLADESLRILGNVATWREKLVLGGAKFYDDMTVTHSDGRYFERHYETHFKPELCATPKSEAQRRQVSMVTESNSELGGFQPMYFTHSYAQDPRLIEMSFNCSKYQHQFRSTSSRAKESPDPVYQTIFLDNGQRHLWTVNKIDDSKVIKRNWWHQLGHRWQHYIRVVPCMMFINGRNKTTYAGSWTLVVRAIKTPADSFSCCTVQHFHPMRRIPPWCLQSQLTARCQTEYA